MYVKYIYSVYSDFFRRIGISSAYEISCSYDSQQHRFFSTNFSYRFVIEECSCRGLLRIYDTIKYNVLRFVIPRQSRLFYLQ